MSEAAVTEPSALAVSPNERRPSVVLRETRELLGCLNEDVNRSHELMAELESLLQASHVTSQAGGTSAQGAGQVITTRMSTHFKATEPLVAEDDEEEDLEEQQTDLPTMRLKTINSVRRLSSTITLDGALLFPSCKVPSPLTTTAAATANPGAALTSISASPLLEPRRPGALIPRTSFQYSRCMSEARATNAHHPHHLHPHHHHHTSGSSDSTATSELDTSSIQCGIVSRMTCGPMPTVAEATCDIPGGRRYSLNVDHLVSPNSITSGPTGRASTNGSLHQLPSLGQGKVSRTDSGFVEMPPLPTSPIRSRRAVSMPSGTGLLGSSALPPVPGATRMTVGLVGRAIPLLRATSNIGRVFGKE